MASSVGARALTGGSRRLAGLRHAALVKPIERFIARIRAERRIRRGIDELMALDDRMLSDMGLTRGDIARAARYGTFSTTMNDSVRPQLDRMAESAGR
jgi:uncharacterized protein YjiS (DUF1127 family)